MIYLKFNQHVHIMHIFALNNTYMAKPILLYTAIWEDTAEDITSQILDIPDNETIELWLNSPGGSVTAGWSIIAALQEKKNKVNITVMGDASSMAFIMLLFADNVTAYDTANLLVHRAASWFEEIMDEDQLKDIEARNKVIRKKLEARLNEETFTSVTGKSFDDLFSMADRLDIKLNANQAKIIGLVDNVIRLDVSKRNEIESRYFHEIAALSAPKKVNNNNSNKKKMGKLTDLIFGEKDHVLIASINDKQFAYSKLEQGAKIKAVGKGDHEPITGTFETDEKSITVVDNEITAVTELDNKQKQIDALQSKVLELESAQEEDNKDVAEAFIKFKKEQDAKLAEVTAILEKAKLTASSPKLPEGEFQNDAPVDDGLTRRERIQMEQNAANEVALNNRGI